MSMHIKLEPLVEPNSTHLSISCPQSLLERYRAVAKELEEIKQKKALLKESRLAMTKVIEAFEKLLAELKAS